MAPPAVYSTDEDVHNKRDKMETCCTIQTLCETPRRSVHVRDSERIKRVLYFLFNQTTNESAIS